MASTLRPRGGEVRAPVAPPPPSPWQFSAPAGSAGSAPQGAPRSSPECQSRRHPPCTCPDAAVAQSGTSQGVDYSLVSITIPRDEKFALVRLLFTTRVSGVYTEHKQAVVRRDIASGRRRAAQPPYPAGSLHLGLSRRLNIDCVGCNCCERLGVSDGCDLKNQRGRRNCARAGRPVTTTGVAGAHQSMLTAGSSATSAARPACGDGGRRATAGQPDERSDG